MKKPRPLPGSVLESQEPVLQLQAERAQLRLRLEEIERKLAGAIEVHRAQILRSLLSKNETERKLAEGIAVWWDVLPHPKQ